MSLFITGIDTDVGKTFITAGLASCIHEMGVDVGVMKPFAAAGRPQKKGFKSKDVEILCNAAKVTDAEELVNPQFFPVPASPYTASKILGTKPSVSKVLKAYQKLSKIHKMILVEGMGGVMTPILKNYYVADLIKDLRLPVAIITTTRVGSMNHTIMSVKMCQRYKIPIKGIIINDIDSGPYSIKDVKRDLRGLLGVAVLGSVPRIDSGSSSGSSSSSDSSYGKDYPHNRIFKRDLDFKLILN